MKNIGTCSYCGSVVAIDFTERRMVFDPDNAKNVPCSHVVCVIVEARFESDNFRTGKACFAKTDSDLWRIVGSLAREYLCDLARQVPNRHLKTRPESSHTTVIAPGHEELTEQKQFTGDMLHDIEVDVAASSCHLYEAYCIFASNPQTFVNKVEAHTSGHRGSLGSEGQAVERWQRREGSGCELRGRGSD